MALGGLAQRLLGLGDRGLVLLGLGHLDQPDIVVDRGAQALDRADRASSRVRSRITVWASFRIVPERRILGACVQLVQTYDRSVVVKDAS